jgi:hypothetical protein
MAKKDRDYDEIIRGCDNMIKAIETLKTAAKALHMGASSAEATLKDKVGKKDINNVQSLAEVITKVTATGEERVLELERQMKKEKDYFERLMQSR